MKKIALLAIVMMSLIFSSCNPTPEESKEMVKVSCCIPLNNGGKSDFSNLTDGKINWSKGVEKIYLAIPGETPTIVELSGIAENVQAYLTFTGEIEASLLETGSNYDVWYFGHSQQNDAPTPYYVFENNEITGSIATQSGRLEDLGYYHIAKTTVRATVNGDVTLKPNGPFENQIAIASFDLKENENSRYIYGGAIKGTKYTLAYKNGTFGLEVINENSSKINVSRNIDKSYVVLFPCEGVDTEITWVNGENRYVYIFNNGIKASTLYQIESGDCGVFENKIDEDGMLFLNPVDLGIGICWANNDFSISGNNCFSWGEVSAYAKGNCSTYGVPMDDISGNAIYDPLEYLWANGWRIPTKLEMENLIKYCTWEFTTQNGEDGFLVKGWENYSGNSIFFPVSGYYDEKGDFTPGIYNMENKADVYLAHYWTSTPGNDNISANAIGIYNVVDKGDNVIEGEGLHYKIETLNRCYGIKIRPVKGNILNITQPSVQEKEATTATVKYGVSYTSVSENGPAVISTGVCWNTSGNPTLSDSYTDEGTYVGSDLSSMLTDLVPGATYYVRPYVTTTAGTQYGAETSFTTENTVNGHEFVDMGFTQGGARYWATCNLGATDPMDKGGAYTWGAVTPDSQTPASGLGIQELQDKGIISAYKDLTAEYDAARVAWGEGLKMPTITDLYNLESYCDSDFIYDQNGKLIGCKFTSHYNHNSITLPVSSVVGEGYYWSSNHLTVKIKNPQGATMQDQWNFAGCLYFGVVNNNVEKVDAFSDYYRDAHLYQGGYGYHVCIRPVLDR